MRNAVLCLLVLPILTSLAWGARQLQDDTGRTVVLPDRVHRVVSLAPSATNTVYVLGAADDLVGITKFSRYPAEAARQKPSVGDVLHPSLEKIVSLRPDLVIGVPSLNDAEIIRSLERVGIPVFLLKVSSLSDVYQAIGSIGKLLGREDAAIALVSQLRSRESGVRSRVRDDKRPSVFLALSVNPCITAGRNAFITELLSAAGARSVTEDIARDWVQVNVEAVIPKRPDYILLMKGAPFGVKEMQLSAGWNQMEAVRNGRVLFVDDRIQYPSPVAFDVLEDLARQISSAQVQQHRRDK